MYMYNVCTDISICICVHVDYVQQVYGVTHVLFNSCSAEWIA